MIGLIIINAVFLALSMLYLAILLYLLFLAIVSFIPEKAASIKLRDVRFAIVIPAQNEAAVIRGTLDSITRLDYSKEAFDVYVIADNCDDDTAAIARSEGCECLERSDLNDRGKGFALRWAFPRLLAKKHHNAYVIIDADTQVDIHLLRCFQRRVSLGASAIQGYYDIRRPDESPLSGLTYLSFVLSRSLKYTGRSRLGWTSNLLGNGMCFTRQVIESHGWPAVSTVEDIEYEMLLHLNGIRVVFAPEAKVYADMPVSFRQSENQRGRWDIGKFRIRNRFLFSLISAGIKKRDLSYFDSAMELLLPPFSWLILAIAVSFFLYLVFGFTGVDAGFILWLSVMGGFGLYVAAGLIMARASLKIYLSLLYAPLFLLWRVYNAVRQRVKKNHREWVKTERE